MAPHPFIGVTWAPGGRAKVVWDITGEKITRIDMVANADSLNELDLVILDRAKHNAPGCAIRRTAHNAVRAFCTAGCLALDLTSLFQRHTT